MLKGLNRLWWSGVKQIRKAQKSRNKKLINSLFAKPAPKRTPCTKAAPAKRIRYCIGDWLDGWQSAASIAAA